VDTKPNILLITADALRADHLGCYGYGRDTSPCLDAFAEEGVLCEGMFCSGIPTQPSFTSLYTGQHPITHGIVAQGGKVPLSKQAPFLTQLLLPEGYTTCAVDNLVREKPWFSRGMEFCIDPSVKRTLLLGVTCEELNARAIPWLYHHGRERFFLHIHYWDPHYPLTPPTRYQDLFYDTSRDPFDPNNEEFAPWWKHPLGRLAKDTWLRTPQGLVTDPAYLVALYDREIRHLDDGLAELLGAVDKMDLAEQTLVIVTADHGESLTEHGIFCEHHGLYDPTIRIPFIARLPGVLPQSLRLKQLVQTHDVAPTLLDAIGKEARPSMDGRTFWPLLTGEDKGKTRNRIVSLECSWQAKWCLRTDRYKFILAREPDFYGNPIRELYDLHEDPEENRNLEPECRQKAQEMEEELEDWIREHLKASGQEKDPLVEQGISLGAILKAGGP
jgi:arylsulfatase